MEQRHLNAEESSRAGEAVGTLIGAIERVIGGNYSFTEDESKRITEAILHLNENFDEEELIELFMLGYKGAE